MNRILEVASECVNTLLQLRRAEDAGLPSAEELHERLRAAVDGMHRKASGAGIPGEDVSDASYAVVALADEFAMARPALRPHWASHQLQLHYFQENVAGEAFFTRLSALRRDPRKRDVVEVYYLALALGFRGRYRIAGGDAELATLIEELRGDLCGAGEFDGVLSPQAERPAEPRARRRRRAAVPLFAAAAAVALCGAVYLGLFFSASGGASDVTSRVASLQKR